MAIGLWVEKGFIVESNGLGLQVFVEEAKEF
jgi:tRNA(Ile)-lysidine synthase